MRAAAESLGYDPADVTLGRHVPGVSAGAVFTRELYVGSMYLGTISGQGVFRFDRQRPACRCAELGATGRDQRHTLCPAHGSGRGTHPVGVDPASDDRSPGGE